MANYDKFTLEQRVFMYDTYVKTESCREVCRQFQDKFPTVSVPNRETVRRLIKKLRRTGSLNAKCPKPKRRVLNEEKLVEIHASFTRSPNKPLRHVAQEVSVSKSLVHTATKILKLKRCQECINADGHHFQHLL
ncbi:hypothetical protein C0J52_18540 [Blattella germanica]|nr:hypothetical protein C0J52_18540 [Blattella germanica]